MRAPVLAAARSAIELVRPADETTVFLRLIAPPGDRDAPAGLAYSLGGYFGGDDRSLFYARWIARDARRTGPLRWYDTFAAYRRPALGDELFRGCPLPYPPEAP